MANKNYGIIKFQDLYIKLIVQSVKSKVKMFSGKCFQITKQLEKHVFNQLTSTQIIVRHGHRLRGKAPGVARTLEQRIQGIFKE